MDYLILLVITYMVLVLASSQIPPGSPVIDGPQVIVLNSQITLTCTSPRGDPPPSVKWFSDDSEITTGISTTTAGTAVTTSLTFAATKNYHLEVLECQAENGVIQNPLSTAKYIEVHFSPEPATLTGPTTLTPGQQGIWTCMSTNGYPAGVMSMRNQNKNTQFTTEFTSNSVLDQKSYDVTGTVTWSPVSVNNGDIICCDVTHKTTATTPQTVCRQITVSKPIAIKAINPVNPVGTPPITSIPQSSYTQISGQQIILGCTVNSPNSPLQEVQWTFSHYQGQTSDYISVLNSDRKYSGSSVNSPSLTINSVASTDQGVYSCFARNLVGTSTNNPTTSLTVTGSVPEVQINPTTYTATYGSQVVINCNIVFASPAATQVYWQRSSNNQVLRIDNGDQGYQGSTTSIPSLTIIFATTANAGVYTCFTTNAVGSGSSNQGTVTITGGVLSVFVTPQYQMLTYGRQLKITCTVSGTPSAQNIAWLFTAAGSSQQFHLNTANSQKYTDGSTNDPFLVILNFQPSDAGTYVCRATNAAGSTSSNPGSTLIYISEPTTNVEPRQFTATVGDTSFQIQCMVTATSGATSWYWTFQPVGGSQQTIAQGTNDNQYTVDNSGTNPHLTVKSIALNEAGIYTCYATNAAGTSDSANNPSSRHTLTVIGGDLDITVSLTAYSAITGDSIVTILCQINGTAPAIAWDWTNTPVNGGNSEIISQGTNNARRQVINSATKPNLNIYSITEDDEGIYRCRANNGKQQYISEPIILKVQEASLRKVPGEPQTNNALEVEEGRTVMLTCSSTGGNPSPSVVWLKDSMLISTGSNSSIFGNVTTTTLTFVTTSYDNLEVYACQTDNGFLQRPLVKTTYLLFSPSNKPPGQPIITGSQRYDLGDTVTLSCSSTGGNPLPTVNWLRDDNIITTGISRFSGSGVTRITLTFVAGLEDHLEVFECQTHNDYLQNPLVSTTNIELYFAPRVPTLTGPSSLISGSSGKWTCSSANGYPAPSLSMRIQDRQYTNEITVVQSYDVIDKSYSVAGTLNLVPSTDKTGQDLCCDVSYLFDNNEPQSTCLQLTINDKDKDNIIIYVVIGILAVLVLFVLLVVMIRYIIGREKGKDNANIKYISQQAAFSNQQDNADNSTHRDRGRDYEGLSSNRREMHVYNTSHDNVEYSHYSTIPADHVFVEPNHTHHSILKQDSPNLKPDTTDLEPGHSISTADNDYLEPDQTYFQPKSGNAITSTT